MDDILEILLKGEKRKLPQKEIKLKRLSKELGTDIVFKLQALPYDDVAEIKRMDDDANAFILLKGVISPDLKNQALMDKYDAVTPVDMIKEMLLAGEIEDIGREIEKLSGFRESTVETVEELKKK